MIKRCWVSFCFLNILILSGCSTGDDGNTGPEIPQAPTETWLVAAESSFDIKGLTWDPAGGLIAVGGDRVLTGGPVVWTDTRLAGEVGLRDVWATDGLVLAVGDNGLLLSRDTNGWNVLDVGTTVDLRAVSGRSSSDALIVGDAGTILHFDGLAWHNRSVFPGETFMDVWCSPTGVYFAVSVEGNIWSDSGQGWTRIDLGIPDYIPEELVGVVGLSDSFILAYGDHERVLLFDGSSWIIDRDGPSASSFVSMTIGTDGDPIAVTQDRRILTRTGGSWQVAVSLGFPIFPTALCTGLDGEVYLVGSEAGVLQMASVAEDWDIIHRYWSDDIVTSVSGGLGQRILLAESGLIWKFVDGQWTAVRPDPATIVSRAWSADGSSIVTIGVHDQIAVLTGSGFLTEPLGLNMTPRGIDGLADGTLLIVGRHGRIIHGTLGNWSEHVSGTAQDLQDVCFLGPATALAVGDEGTALVWDGSSWQAEPTGTQATLLKLTLGPAGEIYALGRVNGGGAAYQVFQRTGYTWQALGEVADLGTDLITDITVDENGNLRACSNRGTLFLFEGNRWYVTEDRPEFRLYVISGNGAAEVLSAGGNGVVLTFSD